MCKVTALTGENSSFGPRRPPRWINGDYLGVTPNEKRPSLTLKCLESTPGTTTGRSQTLDIEKGRPVC